VLLAGRKREKGHKKNEGADIALWWSGVTRHSNYDGSAATKRHSSDQGGLWWEKKVKRQKKIINSWNVRKRINMKRGQGVQEKKNEKNEIGAPVMFCIWKKTRTK